MTMHEPRCKSTPHRLDLATRSSSSFFCEQRLEKDFDKKITPVSTLIAYEFDEPLAALISSSARHSAMDLTLRKADSRVYNNNQYM